MKRYPVTKDTALQPWSNAEILAFDYLKQQKNKNIHIFNDRFGVWNCLFSDRKTTTILTYASQKKAVLQNLNHNNFSAEITCKSPLDKLEKIEFAVLKVPKSLNLFQLFLQQIHQASDNDTEVVCSFMTKYFSSSILKIASIYFNDLEQSKAWKKARLLILKNPKPILDYKELIHKIEYDNTVFKQYYGVFSSDKIDIGTQFLLENFKLQPSENRVLDLASGNGVIAKKIKENNPTISITLIDDFNLAIASSKINLQEYESVNFICDDGLLELNQSDYDLVISNPPFHFEHENNIEITLSLFLQVKAVLKQEGRFVLVANKHLNYTTHLKSIFRVVDKIKENNRFEILQCSK